MMALLANGSDSRFRLQNCPKRGASSAPQLLSQVFTTKIVIVGEQFFGRGCGKQSFQFSVSSFEDLDVFPLSLILTLNLIRLIRLIRGSQSLHFLKPM
jgi:hypothetical protein